jgi:hypothetical protein
VSPSYSNFFLEALQERLICCLRLVWVGTGCILILQAVQLWSAIDVFCSQETPLPLYKAAKDAEDPSIGSAMNY